jgi:hypothetical protein
MTGIRGDRGAARRGHRHFDHSLRSRPRDDDRGHTQRGYLSGTGTTFPPVHPPHTLTRGGPTNGVRSQPAARIVRLTAADLQVTDTGAQIRLGCDMAALPAQLRGVAELLTAITADDGWCSPARRRDSRLTRRTSPAVSVASGFRSPELVPERWLRSLTRSRLRLLPTCWGSMHTPSATRVAS